MQPRRDRDLTRWASVRVTGVLTTDAHIASAGAQHQLLILDFRPAEGLPYHATIDLGPDPAARDELPLLRAGALVSVGGRALQYRTDHDRAVLRVLDARDLVIPLPQEPQ